MSVNFETVPDRIRGGDSYKWEKYRGGDVIPAWVADMDFPSAPAIVRAATARAENGIFGYSQPPLKLAETVGEYFFRKWRWEINPEWIVWSPGLGVAIHTVCRMAGEAGDDILTPSPIYHVFRKAAPLAGRNRVDVPMTLGADGEWRLEVAALEDAATPKSRVLQLCNPHNPNGKIFTRDELAALAEFCERRDLILCADEVHADLILDETKRHHCVAALDAEVAKRTIVMQSPSKAYNIAGLNFAVVVIPDATLRRKYRETAAGQVISHLNPIGLAAAESAWNGECDDWLRQLIVQLRANRNELSEAISRIPGIEMPRLDSTYLAWLNVRGLQTAHGLQPSDTPSHFENHGLGMSPGADFGDENRMRLNFACPPKTLREIIRRLSSAAANN